jgi:hypothetical protein
MKILIIFIIVHIVCSLISKISIIWVFNELESKGARLINTGDGEEVDKKMNNFCKKYIPHIPILNIFIALMTIKLMLSYILKRKK